MPENNELNLVKYNIHAPRTCVKCGKAEPEYKGVGEYKCRECGFIMYDDYGTVRNYLEAHRGASPSVVSKETGVSMETIRHLLRDEKIEIISDSGAFLSCEVCRSPIKSGRYCALCAKKIEQIEKEEKAAQRRSDRKGYDSSFAGESNLTSSPPSP